MFRQMAINSCQFGGASSVVFDRAGVNNNVAIGTPNAVARRSTLSSEMFLASLSTCATNVRCKAASNASASWLHPRSLRRRTTFQATTSRSRAPKGSGVFRAESVSAAAG